MPLNNENRKKWARGKDMPLFSGKTWIELEDIWPREARVQDDAYMILGLFAPAWRQTKEFIEYTYSITLRSEEFFYLCWFQRVEEARENVAFLFYPNMRAMDWNHALWATKKSRLTKYGFIENLPSGEIKSYRVTEAGKLIIKKFIDNLNQVREQLLVDLANNPQHDRVDTALRRTYEKLEGKKEEEQGPATNE